MNRFSTTDILKTRRVAPKFVPRLLTDARKEKRVTVSQELFERSNDDKNFLKNVITGDKTWMYRYDVETKVQLSQLMGKLSPRPKKASQSRSNVRVIMIVFFFYVSRFPLISYDLGCRSALYVTSHRVTVRY
jgi:hypothetical protein